MALGGITRFGKSSDDDGGSESRRRTTKPSEEKQKRGRWVLPMVLVVTVLLSMWFWF